MIRPVFLTLVIIEQGFKPIRKSVRELFLQRAHDHLVLRVHELTFQLMRQRTVGVVQKRINRLQERYGWMDGWMHGWTAKYHAPYALNIL